MPRRVTTTITSIIPGVTRLRPATPVMLLRGIVVLGLLIQVRALHFYLQANEERCFLEELPSDTIVEGGQRVS